MALLNLRDRVIEATIAYVGGEPGEATASFEHVTRNVDRGRAGAVASRAVGNGQLVSLDWRPRGGAKMNDCELAVTLVSAGEGLDPAAMERILVDADGMVLMLEGSADATERNRAAVARVRDALSRAPERKVPVVVQVNRVDGTEWESPEALAVDGWPQVIACAAKGDGVMETLQRAVDGVVESMHQRGPADTAAVPPMGPPRAEGNPLLTALRQILHATVADQVATLETRLATQMKERPQSDPSGPLVAGEIGALTGRIARLEAMVAEARVADARARAESREEVAKVEELLAELGTRAQMHGEQLAVLDKLMGGVESMLSESVEKALAASERFATTEDVARLEARTAAHFASSREAAATAAKEQRRSFNEETARLVAAAIAPVKSAMETAAAELKRLAGHEGAAEVTAAITRVGASFDDLRSRVDAGADEARKLGEQLTRLDSRVSHEGTKTTRSLGELGEAVQAGDARAAARTEALQAELTALAEEVRKKRSWFG